MRSITRYDVRTAWMYRLTGHRGSGPRRGLALNVTALGMLCCLLFALTMPRAHAAGNDFLVSRWTLADGLPQTSPNALALDARGYLWVGTELGLARFDGSRFRVWDTRHGLPGERVVHLLAAPSGLWVATEPQALAVFRDGRFVPVRVTGRVQALAGDRNGNVWIGASDGLFIAAPEDPLVPRTVPGGPGGVTALWVDADGGLLVASRLGLHRRTAGGAWTLESLGPPEPPVRALARLDGTLVAGARNGFWRQREGGWSRIEAGPLVWPGIAVDRAGNAWLWSREGGLRRYAGGELHDVAALGEYSKLVFSVLPDGSDTVWLGLADEGLLRLRLPLIEALTIADGLPARAVHGVLEDRAGALWLGSLEAGVTRVDAAGVETFGLAQGLPEPAVMSLAESATGEIWVGTTGGLAVLRNGRFDAVVPPSPAPQVRTMVPEIVPEPDGAILFMQQGGVFRYHDGVVEQLVAAGTIAEAEFLYRDRRGTIWIGGRELCAHDDAGLRCFAARQNLPRNYLRCAFETPAGALWFCTYGAGLCRLRDDGSLQCLSEEQGLPHRTVHNVLPDALGWVWLPSNRGLARLELAELERAFDDPGHTLRADVFGLDDGLPDLEFNGGSPPRGIVLRDGRLALPTMGGLALVDPAAVARATGSPPVVELDGLVVNGAETALSAASRLPPGSERISFQYTAILPRDPDGVRFRYLLESVDDGWQAGAGSSSTTYAGLAPGRYRFVVQASAGSGPWSEPAELSLEVQPYLWQTWWFAALVALLLLGLASHLVRLRVRRLVELERLRLRIATDLHDDLGSDLSGIALAAALLEDSGELPADTRRTLGDIRSTTGQLLPRMRDIVWLIDPEKEGLGPLVQRLESIAGSLAAGLEVRFSGNATGHSLKLGMADRRDLLLLFRELITNTARHAEARRLTVRMDVQHSCMELEVRDDGRGFDPAQTHDGTGLRNLRRRAARLGADLQLDSRPGAGTRVLLRLPLTRSGRGRRRRGRRSSN